MIVPTSTRHIHIIILQKQFSLPCHVHVHRMINKTCTVHLRHCVVPEELRSFSEDQPIGLILLVPLVVVRCVSIPLIACPSLPLNYSLQYLAPIIKKNIETSLQQLANYLLNFGINFRSLKIIICPQQLVYHTYIVHAV